MASDWLSFYQPHFESTEAAQAFVQACEDAPALSPARVMMHQAQRLVSLGDDLARLRPGRDALQVLFLLICAEAVAKLQADFEGEGQSKHFVQTFFYQFLSQSDAQLLSVAFQSSKTFEVLSVAAAVDLLYDIRCDVVHEGVYWGFSFHDGDCPMVNLQYAAIARISIAAFRSIVIRACITATRSRL